MHKVGTDPRSSWKEISFSAGLGRCQQWSRQCLAQWGYLGGSSHLRKYTRTSTISQLSHVEASFCNSYFFLQKHGHIHQKCHSCALTSSRINDGVRMIVDSVAQEDIRTSQVGDSMTFLRSSELCSLSSFAL